MKYKTLEERYSREQILKCSLVYNTYDFGCSPVVFINPYGLNEFFTYETLYHSNFVLYHYDLKAVYILELWKKVKEKTDLKFRSWDDYEWYYNPDDNFKKMVFSNPTKKEKAISFFWKELQEIADSGEIVVEEKFYTEGKSKKFWVINSLGSKTKRKDYWESYYYGPLFSEKIENPQKRTWKWNEIKDFFVELSDEELELFNVYEMNQCTVKDIPLFEACSKGDFESIKQAIKNGANVNAINKGYGCLEKLLYQYNHKNLKLYKELNDQYFQYIDQNSELGAHYNDYISFDDPCRDKYIDMYRELEEWYSKESEKIKNSKGKSLLLEYEKIIDYLLDEGLNLNIYGSDLLTLVYRLGNNDLMSFLIQKGASVNDNSISDKIHDIRANFIGTPLLERIENLLSDVPSQISETDIQYLEHVNDLNEKKSILLKAGAKQWIDGWDDSKLEKFYDELWQKIIYE